MSESKDQQQQRKYKKYQLYAGIVEDVPKGVKYSYIPQHNRYVLVFSDTHPEPVNMFAPIDENEVRLSDGERRWLSACKMSVNAEALREGGQEYVELLNAFLDRLEEETQKTIAEQQAQEQQK